MSEFDVNLISAFAKCPAFYDKSNPNFKDRTFTENAWKEISLQLGFDEKVLRDRMFQLRNRYNLEKRKVEMQDGDPNAKSTWPLFDKMSFLEGHIRPRKSYKSIMNRSMDHGGEGHFGGGSAMLFGGHGGGGSGGGAHYRGSNAHMRQYQGSAAAAHFAVQNAHNARLQQLANHFQMMANGSSNDDQGMMDFNGSAGDSFPGIANNFAGLEWPSLVESVGGDNPLNLFQQQQQPHHQQQQHQQSMQQFNMQQQQNSHQRRRDGGGVDSSDIKPEYYTESEEEEDTMRDNETDTTSKSKDDVVAFGQRIADAASNSNQALGELLNSVSGAEEGPSSQARNGTGGGGVSVGAGAGGSDPGQGTTNETDEAFLNPMDILLNRASSVQNTSSGSVRFGDSLKRKEGASNGSAQNTASVMSSSSYQPTFKRRRRNYQNMIPNGMQGNTNGGLSVPSSASLMMNFGGHQNALHSSAAAAASALQHQQQQGPTNTLLTNQTMLLAQLQNTLANQQTFLHQTVANSSANGSSSKAPDAAVGLPDKYLSFSQFLASTLSELDEVTAMELVANFTGKLSNALKEQRASKAPSSEPEQHQQENHHNLSNASSSETSNNLHQTPSHSNSNNNRLVEDSNYPTHQY